MQSNGGMVLTGERSAEQWWDDTDRGEGCRAMVGWY